MTAGTCAIAATLVLVLVQFTQINRGKEEPVWINPDGVVQIRAGMGGRGTTVVFGSGTFIEVEGTPREVARKLEHRGAP